MIFLISITSISIIQSFFTYFSVWNIPRPEKGEGRKELIHGSHHMKKLAPLLNLLQNVILHFDKLCSACRWKESNNLAEKCSLRGSLLLESRLIFKKGGLLLKQQVIKLTLITKELIFSIFFYFEKTLFNCIGSNTTTNDSCKAHLTRWTGIIRSARLAKI